MDRDLDMQRMDAAFPDPKDFVDFYAQQAYFDDIDEHADDLPLGRKLHDPGRSAQRPPSGMLGVKGARS